MKWITEAEVIKLEERIQKRFTPVEELDVEKVTRYGERMLDVYDTDTIRIIFTGKNGLGKVDYDLFNSDIVHLVYTEHDEEDIYSLIHQYVEKNITWKADIRFKGTQDKVMYQ